MKKMNENSHDIAEFNTGLHKGAALVITSCDRSAPSSSVSLHIRWYCSNIVRISRGPWSGISCEARTSTHQRAAATPTRRHVPASHATQHPVKKKKSSLVSKESDDISFQLLKVKVKVSLLKHFYKRNIL